mmetsp:Transcript_32204/g.70790  ORF Transcript_32204/g.70790 Transcript_32204/m.70790 type:complete len:428 (-) Transcript_32204:149-1432(-)
MGQRLLTSPGRIWVLLASICFLCFLAQWSLLDTTIKQNIWVDSIKNCNSLCRSHRPIVAASLPSSSGITAGARSASGKEGYVPDPSPVYLRGRYPRRLTICSNAFPMDNITLSTLKKIRQESHSSRESGPDRRPRILCMVYTTHLYHSSLLNAIVSTWAKDCDGFLAASNFTDPSLGSIDLIHQGPEEYGNMWQKVRSMWAYVYDHYIDEYDFFHICGDDAYILVDNLRKYLASKQIKHLLNGGTDGFPVYHRKAKVDRKSPVLRPLFLGTPLPYRGSFYPAGGSGYTLNQAALRLFVERALGSHLVDNIDSREDVFTSVLMDKIGISVSDTRDEEGLFRYMHMNPPAFVQRFSTRIFLKPTLPPLPDGIKKVSKETVAIHLNYNLQGFRKGKYSRRDVEELMYRFHDILRGRCDSSFAMLPRYANL